MGAGSRLYGGCKVDLGSLARVAWIHLICATQPMAAAQRPRTSSSLGPPRLMALASMICGNLAEDTRN